MYWLDVCVCGSVQVNDKIQLHSNIKRKDRTQFLVLSWMTKRSLGSRTPLPNIVAHVEIYDLCAEHVLPLVSQWARVCCPV